MPDYTPLRIPHPSTVEDEVCVRLYNLAQMMNSVVEVGCGLGKSTHALLSGCKGTVYAIDHFKGSPDPSDSTYRVNFEKEFLKNCGGFKNWVLLKMDSEEASKEFEDNSVDMVFIDGSHLYKDVLRDLKNWCPKARKVVCGHDFFLPGVRQAILDLKLNFILPAISYWEHWKRRSDVGKED